jgi:hypothetical protein
MSKTSIKHRTALLDRFAAVSAPNDIKLVGKHTLGLAPFVRQPQTSTTRLQFGIRCEAPRHAPGRDHTDLLMGQLLGAGHVAASNSEIDRRGLSACAERSLRYESGACQRDERTIGRHCKSSCALLITARACGLSAQPLSRGRMIPASSNLGISRAQVDPLRAASQCDSMHSEKGQESEPTISPVQLLSCGDRERRAPLTSKEDSANVVGVAPMACPLDLAMEVGTPGR